MIKTACLLSALTLGITHTALRAMTTNSIVLPAQKSETVWNLLETKEGVSCYYKIDNLGTGKGVFLRFVNNSGAEVTVNWSVNVSGVITPGKLTVAAGQTIDSFNQPAGASSPAVRIASGEPVISFTVSK
jgi:hypothetical protein